VTVPAPPLMHNTALVLAPTRISCSVAGPCCWPVGNSTPTTFGMSREREHVGAIIVVGDAFARPMLKALDLNPARDLSAVNLIASSGAMFLKGC